MIKRSFGERTIPPLDSINRKKESYPWAASRSEGTGIGAGQVSPSTAAPHQGLQWDLGVGPECSPPAGLVVLQQSLLVRPFRCRTPPSGAPRACIESAMRICSRHGQPEKRTAVVSSWTKHGKRGSKSTASSLWWRPGTPFPEWKLPGNKAQRLQKGLACNGKTS